MRTLAFVLVAGLAIAGSACGDDGAKPPDAAIPIDMAIDAPIVAPTFTSFTIDLILNHSTDTTPADFATFSGLPEGDKDYTSLFP